MTAETNPIALGTAQWGLRYGIANRTGRPDEGEVARMLDLARAAGVDTLDTARAYGESESVLGRLAAPDRFRVVTKLAPSATTPEEAQASLDASRRALRRERLDVLLLHRVAQRHAAGGGVWRLLCRERDEGRIGRIGLSALHPEEALEAVRDPEVSVLQVASSLLDRRLAARGFFEEAAARRVEVHVRSAYLQGVAFLDPETLPEHLAPARPSLEAVAAFAAERRVPPHAVFLAWALSLGAARVVLGAEKADQLAANLEALVLARSLALAAAAFAEGLPDLPESVLDPSRWP